jgi:hypothetical protein
MIVADLAELQLLHDEGIQLEGGDIGSAMHLDIEGLGLHQAGSLSCLSFVTIG